MKWANRENIGKHEPLVSKDLFDLVQYNLAKNRDFLIRNRKYDFLLRGLVRCETHGSRLVAEWHKIKSNTREKIAYYHCAARGGCSGSYIQLEILENDINNLFKPLRLKQEFIDLVLVEAKNYVSNIHNINNSVKIGIENRLKALEKKRDQLENLLVDGTINKDVFRRQHDRIQADIDALYNQILDLERKRTIDIKFIEEILYLCKNIYETYSAVSPELKRRYIRLFFENITVKDKKISKVVYKALFKSLLEEQSKVILNDKLLALVDYVGTFYSST